MKPKNASSPREAFAPARPRRPSSNSLMMSPPSGRSSTASKIVSRKSMSISGMSTATTLAVTSSTSENSPFSRLMRLVTSVRIGRSTIRPVSPRRGIVGRVLIPRGMNRSFRTSKSPKGTKPPVSSNRSSRPLAVVSSPSSALKMFRSGKASLTWSRTRLSGKVSRTSASVDSGSSKGTSGSITGAIRLS